MATLEQKRDSLDPNATLAETLTGGHGDTVMVGDTPRHVIGYMRDFLFAPEQARTPLKVLSGGERGRLMLAQALAKPSNVLVLDEPTNDLDLETLDVLEEMLGDYAGTVLLISHDRDFLDRVVSGVIMPEGNGRWLEYAGGYSDMLVQRGEDLARLPVAKAAAKEKPTPRARRRRHGAQAQAQLQREARAGNLAEDHCRLADQNPRLASKIARSGFIQTRPRRLRRRLVGAGRSAGRAGGGGRQMAGAGDSARGDRGRMIPKSGYRFSDKIMRKQDARLRRAAGCS